MAAALVRCHRVLGAPGSFPVEFPAAHQNRHSAQGKPRTPTVRKERPIPRRASTGWDASASAWRCSLPPSFVRSACIPGHPPPDTKAVCGHADTSLYVADPSPASMLPRLPRLRCRGQRATVRTLAAPLPAASPRSAAATPGRLPEFSAAEIGWTAVQPVGNCCIGTDPPYRGRPQAAEDSTVCTRVYTDSCRCLLSPAIYALPSCM